MTPIHIDNVTKRFAATLAVDAVSLRIDAGELFFLLGPSGCGKTTLLRILAGFVEPDAGEVFFGEQRITRLPPRARDAGMVFQTYALWPHMTVAKNVAFGLNVRRLARAEIARRVERVLKLVRMEGYGERRPNQLSGGQQQRVALARALVIEPRVLLLDEPLSNLDARLRDEMRDEIRRLHSETRLTMVYVTHDQKEALALAGRIGVMQSGKLVQVGTPTEVYHHPANRFIAGFLGDSNFVPGTVRAVADGRCQVETSLGTLLATPYEWLPKEGAGVVCSIRPHDLIQNPHENAANCIAAMVQQVTFLGEICQARLLAGQTPLLMVATPQQVAGWQPAAALTLTVAAENVVVLPE